MEPDFEEVMQESVLFPWLDMDIEGDTQEIDFDVERDEDECGEMQDNEGDNCGVEDEEIEHDF